MCLAWWSHCNTAYVFLKKLCFAKECIKIVKPRCTLFSLVFGMQLPEQKGQGRQRQKVVDTLTSSPYRRPLGPILSCRVSVLQAAVPGGTVREPHNPSPLLLCLADKMNLTSLWNPATIALLYVIKFPTSGFPLEMLKGGLPGPINSRKHWRMCRCSKSWQFYLLTSLVSPCSPLLIPLPVSGSLVSCLLWYHSFNRPLCSLQSTLYFVVRAIF